MAAPAASCPTPFLPGLMRLKMEMLEALEGLASPPEDSSRRWNAALPTCLFILARLLTFFSDILLAGAITMAIVEEPSIFGPSNHGA